jgi:dihydroorotate dehydrogenase
MSFIVGIRNFVLKMLYRLFRPLIFLMEPENAHYTLKKGGVLLGSNPFTRLLTGLLFDYGHKSLNTTVNGISYRNPIATLSDYRQALIKMAS